MCITAGNWETSVFVDFIAPPPPPNKRHTRRPSFRSFFSALCGSPWAITSDCFHVKMRGTLFFWYPDVTAYPACRCLFPNGIDGAPRRSITVNQRTGGMRLFSFFFWFGFCGVDLLLESEIYYTIDPIGFSSALWETKFCSNLISENQVCRGNLKTFPFTNKVSFCNGMYKEGIKQNK